jgi:CheY-like chemotaxis protein
MSSHEDPGEILFVDDEGYFAEPFVRCLRIGGYTVHFCETVAEAKAEMLGNPKLRAMILDIMMPPPDDVASEETADGQETGLYFLKGMKSHIEARWLPVFILTNRDAALVEERVRELGCPDALVIVKQKIHQRTTPPELFLDPFKNFIERAERNRERGRKPIELGEEERTGK